MTKEPIKPPLKWAGGKRWFASNYIDLFDTSFDRYVEPFFGSGAAFFHFRPQRALISDYNKELIQTYRTLAWRHKKVEELLTQHHENHCKDYYYAVRSSVPAGAIEAAARFIYLNRTCWNGLYRVNLNGDFNVPMGTKTDVIYEDDDFAGVAKALRSADIRASDFELVIDSTQVGDLLFCDPPYTVKHNRNGFLKYNEKIFSWSDQERLAKCLTRAKNRRVKIILTNACHPSIRELYEAEFHLDEVSRSSTLASNSRYRTKVEELIITSI